MKNKTFKNELFSFLILILSFLFAVNARASGTVIGNGGDPIFEFLSATRESMIETIKLILNDPKEQNSFCQTSRLNDQQIRFCQEYFLAVAPQILRLSQGDNQTLFVLRDNPLYVR